MYQFDKQLDQVSQFIKKRSWLDAANELNRAIKDHEELTIAQVQRFTELLNQVKRQPNETIQQKTETIYIELFTRHLSVERLSRKEFFKETAIISQLLGDIAEAYEQLKQTEMAAWYASYALHQALSIKHSNLILKHQVLLKRLQITLLKSIVKGYLLTIKQPLDLSPNVKAVKNAMQIFSHCLTPLIKQEDELQWLIELYRMAEPLFDTYCQQLVRRIQLCLAKENDEGIESDDTWFNLAEEAITQLEFFYLLETWLKEKGILTDFDRKEKIHDALHERMKHSESKEPELQELCKRYFNFFSKDKLPIKFLSVLVEQSHEDGAKLDTYRTDYKDALETDSNNNLFMAMQRFQEDTGKLLTNAFKLTAEILGQMPNPGLIASKGSWARGDMGQFSDFDSVIFIEKTEPSNRLYYQTFLQLFRIYLIGLGQPWCFVNDRIEPTGLYFDKGDLNIFLPLAVDPNDNNAPSNLAIQLDLIQSPEALAKKVSESVNTCRHANETWQSSYGLLLLKGIYGNHTLMDKYYNELVQQINLYDIGKKSLGFIKKHELPNLDAKQLSLKDVCKIFLLTMLNLCYLQLEPKKLQQLHFTAIWQQFSTQLNPAFALRWREAVEKLLKWRTYYQAIYKNRDIAVQQMSQEEQTYIEYVKTTLITPFYAGIMKYLEEKSNIPFSPTVSWLETQTSAISPAELKNLIINLHLAWKEKKTVNLNYTLGQGLWQYVINYIEQEFVLRGFVGDQDPLLQQQTQWEHITVAELLNSTISAGVDADQLLPTYQSSVLENAMAQNQIAWALALMSIGAGKDRRFKSETLLDYINQFQHESFLTIAVRQAKTSLAKHHPLIAWTLSKATLFQAAKLNIPGFSNFEGRMIGMDSGEVFLTEDVFNQIFEIKKTMFGNYYEEWRKINTEGNHSVARAIVDGKTFYFKSNPEAPWREDAVLCLAEQTFRGAVAYSELFMYIDIRGNATPVLVIQGIQGFSAKAMLKALSSDPKEQNQVMNQITPEQASLALKKIDPYRFATLFFLIVLTGNEDNNPGNLMFESNETELNYLLQLIDCDHSFFEALKYENDQWILVLKSLLLCLDNMLDSLDKRAVKEFLSLNNGQELKAWINKLQQRQKKHEILAERAKTKTEQYLFEEKIVEKIWLYWQRMREFLTANPDARAIDVLHHAIPRVAVFYEDALNNETTLPRRYAKISRMQVDPKLGVKIDALKSSVRVQQLVKAQPTISLTQAIKCLENIEKENAEINNIIAELKTGVVTSFFGMIKPESYTEVLTQFDWQIPNVDKFIQTLIQKQIGFLTLKLKGCKQLTDNVLEQLLKNAPSLLYLEITDAPNLTDRIWSILEKYCQKTLQRLHLQNLPGLKTTKQQNLSQLQRLTITDCQNLQRLDCMFSELQKLTLTLLPALDRVEIHADKLQKIAIASCTQFRKLTTESTALEQLIIDDCPQLVEDGIRKCIKSGIHLTKLHLPESLRINDMVKRHPMLLAQTLNFEEGLTQRMRGLLSEASSIGADINLRSELQGLLLQEHIIGLAMTDVILYINNKNDEQLDETLEKILQFLAHVSDEELSKQENVAMRFKHFLAIHQNIFNDHWKIEVLKNALDNKIVREYIVDQLPRFLGSYLYNEREVLGILIKLSTYVDSRAQMLDILLEKLQEDPKEPVINLLLPYCVIFQDTHQKVWQYINNIGLSKCWRLLKALGEHSQKIRETMTPILMGMDKKNVVEVAFVLSGWGVFGLRENALTLLIRVVGWPTFEGNLDLFDEDKIFEDRNMVLQTLKLLSNNEDQKMLIAKMLFEQKDFVNYLRMRNSIEGSIGQTITNMLLSLLKQPTNNEADHHRVFRLIWGLAQYQELIEPLIKMLFPFCSDQFGNEIIVALGHIGKKQSNEIQKQIVLQLLPLLESNSKVDPITEAFKVLADNQEIVELMLPTLIKTLESECQHKGYMSDFLESKKKYGFNIAKAFIKLSSNEEWAERRDAVRAGCNIFSIFKKWAFNESISIKVAPVVFNTLKSKQDEFVSSAISIIKYWIIHESLKKQVLTITEVFLADEWHRYKLYSAEILGHLAMQEAFSKRAFSSLIQMLNSSEETVRSSAAKTIASLHGKEELRVKILTALIKAAKDQEWYPSIPAVEGLEALMDYPELRPRIITALFEIICHKHLEVRKRVQDLLKKISNDKLIHWQLMNSFNNIMKDKKLIDQPALIESLACVMPTCEQYFNDTMSKLLKHKVAVAQSNQYVKVKDVLNKNPRFKGDFDSESTNISMAHATMKKGFFQQETCHINKQLNQYIKCVESVSEILNSLRKFPEFEASLQIQQWIISIAEAMQEIETGFVPPQRFEQMEYFENMRFTLLELQQNYLSSQSRSNENALT